MDGSFLDARNLPAEVSGWDSDENFFVEKTGLYWNREGRHEIVVHRGVRVGCVVFLRLLRQAADDFPIAYRVDLTEKGDSSTGTRVSLSRLHPKAPFRETIGFAAAEKRQVA